MAGMEMAALIALAKDALSGDPLTASRLAAELRERFPRDPAGYRIGAVSARALKHFGEAEGHLVEGAERFPRLAWPVVERALLGARAPTGRPRPISRRNCAKIFPKKKAVIVLAPPALAHAGDLRRRLKSSRSRSSDFRKEPSLWWK